MRVALCQIPVSSRPHVNARRVEVALADAADRGADLAVFPEATQIRLGSDLRAAAEPLDGPFRPGLAAPATRTGGALLDDREASAAGGWGPGTGGAVPRGRAGVGARRAGAPVGRVGAGRGPATGRGVARVLLGRAGAARVAPPPPTKPPGRPIRPA